MKKSICRMISGITAMAVLLGLFVHVAPNAYAVGSGQLFGASGTYTPTVSGVYRIVAVGAGAAGLAWADYNNNGYRHDGACGGAGYVDVYLQAGTSYPIKITSGQASFGSYITATPGYTNESTAPGTNGYISYSGSVTGAGVIGFPSNGTDTNTIQPPRGMWTGSLSKGGTAGGADSNPGGGGIFGGAGGYGGSSAGLGDYHNPGRGTNGGGDGGTWVNRVSGGGGGGGYGGGGGIGGVYRWYAQGEYWINMGGPGTGGAACVYIDESALVSYIVEHYQQNEAGNGYALTEREPVVGIIGNAATPLPKSYTGFSCSNVIGGTVSPGAVMKVYYDRTLCAVSFDSNTGSPVSPQTVRWGARATVPTPPAKTGYQFGGWWADQSATIRFDFSTPITGSTTLFASWLPRTDTAYRVKHYQQNVSGDGYQLRETETYSGTTGATITAVPRAYSGFTENTGHPNRVTSGRIAADGSMELALYYDRRTYEVTFDSKGGSPVEPQRGIRYEAVATEPAPPAKTGYTFGGWLKGESSFSFATPITDGLHLAASWIPRNDTRYTIKHFLQELTGAGYTLKDTDQLSGTTDTLVTATPKTYTGFYVNTQHPGHVANGAIAPDGSLILALYYDRAIHRVTFDSAGGSPVPEQGDIRYGGTALEPTAPSKTGYDFGGWCVDGNLYAFAAPVTKDITLTAHWTPRSDTAYTVKHYTQDVTGDGYSLRDTDQLTGTTDASVTAAPKTYTGFRENTGHLSRRPDGAIAPDGSLILALYYDRTIHSVTFDSAGGTPVPEQGDIRYGGTALEPTAPSKTGYDFGGWYVDGGFYAFAAPVTKDVILTAHWTPRSDTAYTVKHYTQDATGDGYSLRDTDQLTGTTDASVTAAPKSYTGFSENTEHISRRPDGAIAPDESLILALYYDRNLLTVTYDTAGGSALAQETDVRWGSTISEPAEPTKSGYDFSGWWADVDATIRFDFTVPLSGDVTIFASWSARADTRYITQHFVQDVSGGSYSLRDTDTLTGTTDAAITAIPQSYIGFHENMTHPDRIPSAVVAPDGSAALSLYYDRNSYTVSFDVCGGEGTLPARSINYGHPFAQLPVPQRSNHTFAGWYTKQEGGVRVSDGDTLETADHVTLYAQWSNEEYGIVDGIIQDQNGNPVANAKITIRAGTVDYKSTTSDEKGRFTISSVKYGTYNLIAEKDRKIVTTLFEMRATQFTQTVVLPIGITNSVVIVAEDTPEIVVGGLDSLFDCAEIYTPPDAAVVQNGGTVELRFSVAGVEREAVSAEGAQIAAHANNCVDMYLDMGVTKEVSALGRPDQQTSVLTELPELMTVIIPLSEQQQGKGGYMVYRCHDGAVNELTEQPNPDGEYLEVQKDRLILYTKKFSLYALAYDLPYDGRTYTITTSAGVGGTILPEGEQTVGSGGDLLVQIVPDGEHSVADVLVDGKSVGPVERYRFTQVYAPHTIHVVFSCPSEAFDDLAHGTWYHQVVDCMLNSGYMQGRSAKMFAPESDISRAEVSMVLARMVGGTLPNDAEPPFEDVRAGVWYTPAVAWAASTEVIVGYGKRRFGPNDLLSREQLALILYRLSGRGDPGDVQALERFEDGVSVSDWARFGMLWAINAGLLVGDNKGLLHPGDSITRAEVATILDRYLNK